MPDPGPATAWSELVATEPLALVGIEISLVELALVRPVRTAVGSHDRRPLALVRLVATGPDGEVEGWGECAALAEPGYAPEHAAGAFAVLATDLVPALVGLSRAGVPGPAAARLALATTPAGATSPMAVAALEMAVADAHLRSGGSSLARALGCTRDRVDMAAVVGRDVPERVAERVAELAAAGFARIRLKIAPGDDAVPLAAARDAAPEAALSADANGSYGGRPDAVALLGALDRFGLVFVEQPLGTDDLAGHASLSRTLSTPVCLDESLDTVDRVRLAVATGACTVACCKPGRLGGIGPCIDAVSAAAGGGARPWIGGMFESGLGRAVAGALAALGAVSLAGDVSPAAWYLVEDLAPPPVTGRGDDGRAWVQVHGGPGVGPAPDPQVVSRLRSAVVWVPA